MNSHKASKKIKKRMKAQKERKKTVCVCREIR